MLESEAGFVVSCTGTTWQASFHVPVMLTKQEQDSE